MYCRQFVRSLHLTRICATTSKSSLATLRKKTGYTFANCKKALEMHNNDLAKAEEWLQKQAQTLGWSKATKLEGRATKQGLVGVVIQNNIGALVEVNCETDFVARNENFRKFVEIASQACLAHIKQRNSNTTLIKVDFEGESLKKLPSACDGKPLEDHLALMIGTVGENAILRRASCFKATEPIQLSGYTHPSTTDLVENELNFGKYGTIVALKSGDDKKIVKNLCQHIVGMNPRRIGEVGKDEPSENKDDEVCLIHQEYLLDPEVTISEVMNENKIEIIDFQRFECGEVTETTDSVLERVKANN